MLNSQRAPAAETVARDEDADLHDAGAKRQTVRSRQRTLVRGSNPSTLAERMDLIQAINADPELSASAVVVAVALMRFVNSKTGECYPTFESIAERCHVSKRTVATAVQDLERRGWVVIERDYGGDREANRYHFAFDRIRKGDLVRGAGLEASVSGKFHGENFAPCSEVHGANSSSNMVQNPPIHGEKFAPILQEDNSHEETQEAANAAPQSTADQERELFRRGKGVLGQNAGGLIKNLLKAKGSVELARAAIETAATKQDPREYIGAIVRGRDDQTRRGWDPRL
ncbi:MAG: helix-turn-helix domain-containing protein [Xanthobacteraceae bacterium]